VQFHLLLASWYYRLYYLLFLPEQVPGRLLGGFRRFFPPGVKRAGLKVDHLFKISNLVYDGREIVRSLYSSLEGQRQTVYGGYSELVGSLSKLMA